MEELNVMLLGIGAQLDDKELKDLKFLCRDKIVKKKMEQINSATDLFTRLMELNEISNENLHMLIKLLKVIKRDDLVIEVQNYQTNHLGFSTNSPLQERSQLDQAIDIICDNLGASNWKMFMRRLGISDVMLDNAVTANPYSLYEQQRHCLREWRQRKGDAANISALREALLNCRLRLLDDMLTEELGLN
uniref:FADD n=1 Tax=Leptobrachium leishanense TaxID=445787 RepID=A0A8C5PZ46_9ANUR